MLLAGKQGREHDRVIRRVGGNLGLRSSNDAPDESRQLERDGFAVIRSALSADEITAITAEIEASFRERPPERNRTDRDEFRYAMLNHGASSQAAIGHPRILEVIEPLLGEDCHVIANTAWNNPASFAGGPWHCDAGPHIPRPRDVPWDDRIPYPIFAIGAHLMLRDCDVRDGPTEVIPGSHRSGRLPDYDRVDSPDFGYDGRGPLAVTASAGDVILFASDLWHRGRPAENGRGRLFLQCHYGRRDIAQRISTTDQVHHLSADAVARARAAGPRAETLAGLHGAYFYDG